jgi:hypothetical protein
LRKGREELERCSRDVLDDLSLRRRTGRRDWEEGRWVRR